MTKSKVGLDADFDTTSDETPSDAETVITEKATPTFNLPGIKIWMHINYKNRRKTLCYPCRNGV